MVDAATPAPENKKATTPSSEAATPAKKGEELTPSPDLEGQNKKVAELEAEVDRLKHEAERQAAHASSAERKRKTEEIERGKLESILQRVRDGDIDAVNENIPTGETSGEKEIRVEAKLQIQDLLLDNPEYQELMKGDLTLKTVLRNNPFALIESFLDAPDAVNQIKSLLDERVSSSAAAKAAQPEGESQKGEGKEFDAGAVQPVEGGGTPPPTSEQNAIEPNVDKTEKSILSKIRMV